MSAVWESATSLIYATVRPENVGFEECQKWYTSRFHYLIRPSCPEDFFSHLLCSQVMAMMYGAFIRRYCNYMGTASPPLTTSASAKTRACEERPFAYIP